MLSLKDWWRRCCGALCLVCGVAASHGVEVAPVYPERPGEGAETAWFLAANGLGEAKLYWSDVELRLGKAEEVQWWPYDRRTGNGGHGEMRYPALGLKFQINSEDGDDGDPRIGWMTVGLPWNGRTPQGLYLGMGESEAMAIIAGQYKVRGSIPLSWGFGGQTTGRSVLAQNHGWRKSQSITFTFRDKRLFRIEAQMKPTPLIGRDAIREFLGAIIAIGFAILLGSGIQALRDRLGPTWERLRTLLGFGVAGAGGFALVAAVSLFGGGDGYAKLAGLLVGLGGLGLLGFGLLLLTQARSVAVSGTSKGILVVALLILVAASLIK